MPLLDSTKSGAWVGDAPLPHQPDYPSPQAQNLLPETACQFESGRGHQHSSRKISHLLAAKPATMLGFRDRLSVRLLRTL